MSEKFHILFVCTGNSCRSPLAEGMLKLMLNEELAEHVVIESAGTMGLYDNPATPLAILAAREKGVDISTHASQGLSADLVENAHIILVMDRGHVDFILENYPEAKDKVHLLKQFGRDDDQDELDIDDPIGGTLQTYRNCSAIIDEELYRIVPLLEGLIKSHIEHDGDEDSSV